MDLKRGIAIIAVVAMLAFGSVSPSPARADATGALILTGVALGAYAGVILIGTTIVYAPPQGMFAPTDVDLRRDAQEPGVRFGSRCRTTSAALTLVCW